MAIETAAIEPDGEIYVIGDVHGCYTTLFKLLKKLGFGSDDCVYLPGDLIDRGVDSKRVVDLAMALQRKKRAKVMRGNHEQLLLGALESKPLEKHWITYNGGDATLASFGVSSVRDIPKKYLNWFKALPLVVKLEYSDGITYVVSHAGVDLGHKRPFRDTETNANFVLWNREKHPNHPNLVNIVGHSPKSLQQIRKSLNQSTIYLDGGCVYGGSLVAFDPNSHKIVTMKNSE